MKDPKTLALPAGIWALGFVSLFMDVSSEIVHGLLPVFLVTVLGASVSTVGILEGIAEGTALTLKVFSGPLSDMMRRRKPLVLLGYTMGALSKPLFALAHSVPVVYGARIFDRMGKGIRGAPRDALIADLVPEAIRGRAYGLRQSLDTVGAFLGPLLAIGLMRMTGDDFRAVFWIAAAPGVLAVAILFFGVREREDTAEEAPRRGIRLEDLSRFDKAFWLVVSAGAIFQLSRFSEAFLILRARDLGLSLELAPAVLIALNIVYSLAAFPIGALSDKLGRGVFLVMGLLVLAAADLTLALVHGLAGVFVGIALWGLHMGLTQGILSAMVADTCEKELRGTAFGLFNLFSAIALVLASTVAGFAWDLAGASATFLLGAGIAFVSVFAFGAAIRWSS